MAQYLPFEFFDNLSEHAKSRLPVGLQITGENDPDVLVLIRLLSGNLGIRYAGVNKKIKQERNYFSPEFKSMGSKWGRGFSGLVGEEVTPSDVAKYIQARKFINKSFYREIIYELINYFVHRSRSSHTSAFIYLYRLLERISYCFPLIYVSMTEDFKKTYTEVKSFFGESKEKDEKAFFKVFIDTIFAGDDVLQTTVDFSFEVHGESVDDAARLCNAVKKVLNKEFREEGFLRDTEISMRYQNVGQFIIAVRNGFFHNLSKQNNLDAEALRDSDVLFKLINDKCLGWIASIFLAIFSYNMSTVRE
ncbi:hypothetical protein D3C81_195150 [compost metagenome]